MSILIHEHDFLKNNYPCNITINGITYPSAEHAYQALKFDDNELRQQIAESSIKEARKIGKSFPMIEGFDRETAMAIVLRKKFQDVELGNKLLNLGSEDIVMQGYDSFWGTGKDGNGDNLMGEIICNIRNELSITSTSEDVEDEDEDECDCEECECDCDCGCCDSDDDGVPTLFEAITNNPDEELARHVQDLFDASNGILAYVDANDYNVEFIASKVGIDKSVIKQAVDSLKKFSESITAIKNLLEKVEDDEDSEFDDEDEDSEYEDGDDFDDDYSEEDDEY